MDKKNDQKAKLGVKFADTKQTNTTEILASSRSREEKPKIVLPLEECRSIVIKMYNDADSNFKLATKTDPEVKRKDTARALCKILDSIKEGLTLLNNQPPENRDQLYYLTYNGTIYCFEICRALRKSVYATLSIQHLAYAIISLERNLNLLGVKFLDWRVKLYVELAHVYEECESFKAAGKSIELAIAKVNEIKEVEESDPPVPEHITTIIANNLRILKALDVKYKLQNSLLLGDAWKKKVEEYFKNDIEGRNMCILESLNQNFKKNSNLVAHAGKVTWKEQVVNLSFDMIKNDIEIVSKALLQINEKMQMTMQLKEDFSLNEESRAQLAIKTREFDNNMILEREWKRASRNVPIELHIEVLKHAYDCLNNRVYGELLQSAITRCRFHRIETPYIVDIEIQLSTIPNSNIPNGYEKIPIDINDSHLRSELAKLRLNIAKEIAKQQEEKKQEKIREAQKARKSGPEEKMEPQPNIQVDASNVAHNYIYFLVKRSYSPERAIYAIDIVMANPETGPKDKLKDGWECKAIKIDQYTGVRETSNNIPWLCLKHSSESLKNEEEKKSLLIDFMPILGKSYLVRPQFGFERINIDLRQVPQQFYKIPNLDFVYLSYKMDKMYYICERELFILKNLEEVEKTCRENKVSNELEEMKAQLGVNYDLEKFEELARVIKNALEGPLGDQFYDAKKDFLIKLGFHVWKKYIVTALHQVETLYELRMTDEISEDEIKKYQYILENLKKAFVEMLEALSKILMKAEVVDIVWLSKINIELCKLLEESQEYRKAAQIMRFCYNKMIEFKDRWVSRGVESKKDVFLPLTITCNNLEIKKMIEEMKKHYYDWKTWLRKEIISKTREKKGEKPLEDDEAAEKDYEFVEINRIYGHDDLKDQNKLEPITFEKAFTEYMGIVNSLHADITIDLIRLELKAGKMSRKLSKAKSTDKFTSTFKNTQGIETIPERLKAKLNIMGGPTAIQIKHNATQLQTTLQIAGKLEPPKPKIQDYEEDLISEGSNNSYFNALLYMSLAGNKSKLPEKEYLLREAMKFIEKAEKEEKTHVQNGIENAVFLFSTLLDDRNAEKSSNQFYPFDHLYKPDYIRQSNTPSKPIFISRSTTTITMKLPPFNPIIPELLLLENPLLKIVNQMSVYGKVSSNGVDVSLTCTDLQNTGTRVPNGAIVTITNLRQNEIYCFAAAGFNPQERVINGIGKTSEDIAAVLPLPINMIYAYLALNAYQIGLFELAEKASGEACKFFSEKTDIKDRTLDYIDNPVYLYRLKQDAIKAFSITEQKIATTNYIVHARCLQRKFATMEKESKGPILYIEKQKNTLMVCNYLLLALEISCASKSFIMSKKIIKELYNDVIPFLSFKTKSKFIFQVLSKAQLLISQIPKEIWDGTLRNCSIKITYELLKMMLQMNEIKLSKLLLFYDSKLPHRKWFVISKTIMIEEIKEPDPKDSKKVIDSKSNKPKSKSTLREEPKSDEPPKLIPKLVRELFSKQTLQDNLEEFLLSLGEEYYDSVLAFIDYWKEQIEMFKPLIDNGQEIVEKKKQDLTQKFEFWDILRDQAQAFTKIKTIYATSPQLMEYICKYLKKSIEKGVDLKFLIEQVKQVSEPINEAIQVVNSIRDLHLRAIEGDVGWNPKMLEELCTERDVNKQGDDLAIELYNQYYKAQAELNVKSASDARYEIDLKWLAEFNFIKATMFYMQIYSTLKPEPENKFEVFFDVTEVTDPERVLQPEVIVETGAVSSRTSKAKIDQLIVIFKHLSNAAVYSVRAKTYYLLQNVCKMALNIYRLEMMTPYDHAGTEMFKYLTIISQSINEMLENIRILQEIKKNNEKTVGTNRSGSVKFEEIKIDNARASSIGPNAYLLDNVLTKDYWFMETDLDMQTLANQMSYCVKVLTVENKWKVIVELTKHFCNETTQFYSIYILPFLEYAQKMLFERAREKTNTKKKELEERVKVFEEWKKKQKRKKRADAMTGAIPQEQQDFEKDETELKKQIDILKRVEDFWEADKRRSSDLLYQIRRDENQALESLNQWRKYLAKFGYDRHEINIDKLSKSTLSSLDGDKIKEKTSEMMYRTLINKYKEIIENLKKKQEVSALIQALHERGNIYFSMNEHKKCVQDWNESLDTIFQRIYSLKSFRDVIKEYNSLAFQIGVDRCLIGSVLLHKLALHGYYNDIHSQMECSLFAYELIFALFKISLPHSFIPISFGTYRVKEILQNQDLFSNKYVLTPADIIMACNYHAISLMDANQHIKALPLLGLMEYLATDLSWSNYYSLRAKLLKAVCLANLGYLNEAYVLLFTVASERDLSMNFTKPSEYNEKEFGYNYFPSISQYSNDLSPYDERNREPIDNILKLEVNGKFKFKYGFSNNILFNYAKSSLIFSIFEHENYDKSELNDLRINHLKRIETSLREGLKRLSFEEELAYLKEKSIRIERDFIEPEDKSDKKSTLSYQLGYIKFQITQLFDQYEIEENEREDHLSHKETTLCYPEIREERISMMMRIRFLLNNISTSMNFTTKAYHIIKTAIVNLSKYSDDQRKVENGYENVNEEFKAEEGKGKGKGAQKEEKKKEEKKEEKKKEKKKDTKVNEEELYIKNEEELLKEFEEELKLLKKNSETRETRNLCNGFWWLKLRTQFCVLLFKHNKLNESQALIELFKKDSATVKDTYFLRTLEEIEAKIFIKKGNIADGLRKLRKVIQHGTTYRHTDMGYGQVIGDFADCLFDKGDIEEAEDNYKLAKSVYVNLLNEIRFEFRPQNSNQKALSEEIKIATNLQLTPDQETSIMKSDKFKMKKDDKKGPSKQDDKKKVDPKKKGIETQEESKDSEVTLMNPLPDYYFFIKDNKENKTYVFANIDEKDASNKIPFVYSIKIYEQYLKASLNYARCLLWKSEYFWDEKTLNDTLEDANCIIQNLYNIPISFKFQLNFLYGKGYRRKFVEEFKKIHEEYSNKYTQEKNKKYRKIHSRVPYKDLLKNNYMIEIPNFSENLKNSLVPHLEKSREYLKRAVALLKNECLLFENGIKPEEAFIEICQVCLYLREYRPRPSFKYYQSEDLKTVSKEKGVDEIGDFEKHLDEVAKSDLKACYDLEWQTSFYNIQFNREAFNYLLYSIQVCNSRLQLEENFAALGNYNFHDPTKIPQDVFQIIMESDYIQKKNYIPKFLWDEKNEKTKKIGVNAMDTLLFLSRMSRESSIFSFTNNSNQRILSKLHRYLRANLSMYAQNCVLGLTEIPNRSDAKALSLSNGTIIAKSFENPRVKEHRLIYMLGPLTKSEIKASNVTADEINKIIINPESEVLYGCLYFSFKELDEFSKEVYELKAKMEISDKCPIETKTRDYKYYREAFIDIIAKFAQKFAVKESSKSGNETSSSSTVGKEEEDIRQILDKYIVLIPDLTMANITVLINLFGSIGLNVINNNYLALFRYCHKLKYK